MAKIYYEQCLGRARHIVNFHNGTKLHNDGSLFFDMNIFRNAKDAAKFVRDLKQDGYRHRDSFRANRILCYPGGFSITILREQGFCILNTPEYKDTKISRSTAAQLLTGIRKGIRDLNQSREAAL